jgi:two-component system invasion response regulator UvrY
LTVKFVNITIKEQSYYLGVYGMTAPHILLIEPAHTTALGFSILLRESYPSATCQHITSLDASTEIEHADLIVLSLEVPTDKKVLQSQFQLLQRTFPDTPIALYSLQPLHHWNIQELSHFNVRTWLSKCWGAELLAHHLHTVAQGGIIFSGFATEPLLSERHYDSEENPLEKLWFQEVRVLKGLARGWGKHRIADDLSISVKTVQKYQTQILVKLEVDSAFGLLKRPIVDALEQWRDEDDGKYERKVRARKPRPKH